MLQILFFYLILPFTVAFLLMRFIKKYGASQIPPDVTALLTADPLEKKFFRAARRDEQGLFKIGDYETHGEAVDAIYAGKEAAQASKQKGAFIVLNDKGETLDWIDA